MAKNKADHNVKVQGPKATCRSDWAFTVATRRRLTANEEHLPLYLFLKSFGFFSF
jgi:hypothetical protein